MNKLMHALEESVDGRVRKDGSGAATAWLLSPSWTIADVGDARALLFSVSDASSGRGWSSSSDVSIGGGAGLL